MPLAHPRKRPFVKRERGEETEEVMAALTRIEAELVELKRQVASS